MNKSLEYDYIVIGSGAGGGVVFDELKKNNKNVLLIEKGPHIKSKNLKKEFYHSLKNIWKSSGYQYADGNISLPILQGISLGGSTTINGSIMQELEENFCNKLISIINTNNKNFKFDNLLKFQNNIKKEFNITSTNKEFNQDNNLINELKKNNWEYKFLERAISDDKYLDRTLSGNSIESIILRKYNGSNILTNLDVKLIVKDKKKILGVKCFDKTERKNIFIKVKKKLIVSCGVLGSAKLLMKSNIKNKNLGKKFSCHLSGAVDALFLEHKKKIEGTLNAIEITTDDNSCKKFANQNVPDEIILSRIPFENHDNLREKLSKVSSWVYNVSSKDTGYIKNSFFNRRLKFNITDDEFKKVKKFIFKISDFLFRIGAINVFPNVLNKNNLTKNMSEIETLLSKIDNKDLLLTASHLFGTCCIGKDENNGVVDENFKVFNYENLFVVDSSVFPFTTSYNPQLTIMIYAKLASNLIINE
tara:strand:+ start:19458 stop:20882 length:1425 start_codon:yes stop_codon:yes gene_type:complete